MNFLSILYSLVLGGGVGALYGASFLTQNSALLKGAENFLPQRRSFFISLTNSLMRLLLIGLFWLYVLRTPSVSIILVLSSFLGSFWTVLMLKKVYHHAKR